MAGDDVNTAYVAGRIGVTGGAACRSLPPDVDADVPLIWRTTDGGKTWTSIVNGLPKDERTGSWVNSLRADPVQPGLLFAGTETTVYVSFDNGDHWQSLRQNLPSTSIRDLAVHTDHHLNDLVISTYGRGFWVLDDITPLREIAAHATGHQLLSCLSLSSPRKPFAPVSTATGISPSPSKCRMRPMCLMARSWITTLARSPAGRSSSRSSTPRAIWCAPCPARCRRRSTGEAYPHYWLATPESRALSTHVGLNRVNWNLNYDDPPALRHDLENEMNMVEGATTPGPHGPQVIPGVYTLKLTVDGQVYTRQVTVVNDPRVGQSPELMAALRVQNQLTLLSVQGMQQSYRRP